MLVLHQARNYGNHQCWFTKPEMMVICTTKPEMMVIIINVGSPSQK
jgi:hypothetical protein